LTAPNGGDNNTHKILLAVGVSVPKGNIRCSKCHKAMSGPVCSCGHTVCYISIYWEGKQYRFFKYRTDNELFNYKRALKQLTEINFAIDKREFNPVDWTTRAVVERKFGYQAERWINQKKEEMEIGEIAHETLRTYHSYINNHFMAFFEKWDVREIRFEQIQSFKEFLGNRVSINTRKKIIGALHSYFKWMWRNGIIKEMPGWPIMEGEEVVKRAVDYDTQADILNLFPPKYRDVFEFGAETGLRPNELCALKVLDIDVVNGKALIQRGYSGPQLHDRTKGKNKRWIPLSDRAFTIALKNLRDKVPHSFLFINPNTGHGYTLKSLDNVWRKFTDGSITKNEFMRHSFITQLFEMGASEQQVQALSRHKDKRSLDSYIHMNVMRLKNIVNNRSKIVPIERALNENKKEEIKQIN
jgi:integrase